MLQQLNKYKSYDNYRSNVVKTAYREFLQNPDIPDDVKEIIKDEYDRDIPPELEEAGPHFKYFEERKERIYDAKYLSPKVSYINNGNALEVKKFKDWVKLNKSIENFKNLLNDPVYKTKDVDLRAQLQELINIVKDRRYNVLYSINLIGHATLMHVSRFNTITGNWKSCPDISYPDELKFIIETVRENESKWKALLEYFDKVQNIAEKLQNNLNELYN